MSAVSISVSYLAWSTPDGQPVLEDITLDFSRERAGLVGRNGIGKSTLLRLLAGELIPARGTVRVAGTIGTLRQTVQVKPGETVADLLGAAQGLAILRRAEAGTATIEDLDGADWTLEARASQALAEMGLHVELDTALGRISGGQRTRVALAALTLAQPDFLLLDEPTNNLDRGGRQAVLDMLGAWPAGAIVVSHDRELLEEMDAIVELTTLGAQRYGGGWSHYAERKAIDVAAARHDLEIAERHRTHVARKTQAVAERQQRRDAAGGRKAAQGGMPRILLGARRERAENTGAGNVRLAEHQRGEADRAVGQAKDRVEHIEPLTVEIAPTGLGTSRDVLGVVHVTFGHVQDRPILRDVSLQITGPQRIAIIGANGSGKSTLLRIITGDIAPWSGHVERHVSLALLDQQVSLLSPDETIAENFVRLNPGTNENGCRAALARFRFRAASADQRVSTLSGGQMLRAGLACVIGSPSPPPLLILDEPTNHLDIESIEAVESGLIAYDGALLVVSHDERFLERIGITARMEL